jgi:hypothetical protein
MGRGIELSNVICEMVLVIKPLFDVAAIGEFRKTQANLIF